MKGTGCYHLADFLVDILLTASAEGKLADIKIFVELEQKQRRICELRKTQLKNCADRQ